VRWAEIVIRPIPLSRNAIGFAATLISLAGFGAFMLFPLQPPTSTTGPFAVGMSKLELSDPTMAPEPNVQLWYPADRMTTGSDSLQPPAKRGAGWPPWRRIDPVIPAAAPAVNPPRFPVILYFSGWVRTRLENAIAIGGLAPWNCRGYGSVPGKATRCRRRCISAAEDLERPMDFSSTAALQRTIDLAANRVRAQARYATILLNARSLDSTSTTPNSKR
jgi:hypothetical protein